MKEKSWIPQDFKTGNEDAIIWLMQDDINNRSSQAIFTKELWNWKYKYNNAGYFENWIKLAKSKNDDFIGGHYTVIPVFLKANGIRTFGAQSVDTITHVNFRKQGVFTELAELCYKDVAKDKVNILFGYPNDNSYPGFVSKLDWKTIMEVQELGYILDISKLVNYKFKKAFINLIAKTGLTFLRAIHKLFNASLIKHPIEFEAINIYEINTDIIDNILSQHYSYYVDRSMDYLKWRYLENPIDKDIIIRKITFNDEIIGYYILKVKNYPHRNNIRIAHIMELILKSNKDSIYKCVLKDIARQAKNENCSIVYTYTHKFQGDYSKYKRFGYIKLDSKNYIVRVLNNEENFPGIYDPSNWFVNQGDSDRA